MKKRIRTAARVIRSKNSGPYELTLDIFFKNRQYYDEVKKSNVITPNRIAKLYQAKLADVLKVVWFEPALAVKATLKRIRPSGHPGESDVYGAQQHALLLDLEY